MCDSTLSRCWCRIDGNDHDIHRCDCGGSWQIVDGQPKVVTFPVVPGVDPWLVMILAGPPLPVKRGAVRFVPPPEFQEDTDGS